MSTRIGTTLVPDEIEKKAVKLLNSNEGIPKLVTGAFEKVGIYMGVKEIKLM